MKIARKVHIFLVLFCSLFLSSCKSESPAPGDSGSGTTGPSNTSISIENGNVFSQSTSITLSLGATGASQMYVTNTSGCGSGGSWETYATTKSWTLAQTNSTATVYVKFRDDAGNESDCTNDSIIHDNVGPVGISINIDSGSSETSSTSVNLSIGATGASQMYVTNTSGCGSGGSWETYATTKSWTLAQTNSTATVYVKFRDDAGNESDCTNDSITHNSLSPTGGSISINSGATYTVFTTVTLTLGASGASEMYLTNTAGCGSGGSWETYATTKSWTLAQTNSTATAYIKFRNSSLNESPCISDSIIHDNLAPSGTILINSGDTYTNSLTVSLALSSTIDVVDMYITNTAGCSSGGTWEPFVSTKAWTLSNLNANNRVYVNYRDGAGNLGGCINDLIIHDNVAPTTASVSINSGATTTTNADVTLTLASTGASQMYITNTAGCSSGGTWENYATSKSWRMVIGNGTRTVYTKFRDLALNETACTSDSISNDGIGAWSASSTTGAPSAMGKPLSVWSGSEMIVWGGNGYGGRYNPVTNSWTTLSNTDSADGWVDTTPIWTGSEMIVWAGRGTGAGAGEVNTMGIYDPTSDSWLKLNGDNAPQARYNHSSVWTGSKMIIWGGRYSTGGGGNAVLNTGSIYDPSTNTWSSITTTGAPTARDGHSAVWTGSKMIIWGGFGSDYKNDGASYDPASNSWSPISTPSFAIGKLRHSTIWTGSKMIVYGGGGYTSGVETEIGAMYDPSSDSWTALNQTDAPSDSLLRYQHSAVWTGSKMIVWGGTYTTDYNNGGLFDPITNTWEKVTTTDVITGRWTHTAVWTGSEMVIWGGTTNNGLTTLNSGGILSFP